MGLASHWRLPRGEGQGGRSSKAKQALESRPSFVRVVARSSLRWKSYPSLWRSEGGSLSSGLRLRLSWVRGFCHRVPRAPSGHCSHRRRMSLEDRLLFCSPARSRRRTSFGTHKRSVQARVSLREVTLDKAARKQWAQDSWAAFGMCVLGGRGRGR